MTNQDFQDHVIDSLARLDTKVEALIGNGQPGRVGILEKKVEDLSRTNWYRDGLIAGIATTLSAGIHFLFKR